MERQALMDKLSEFLMVEQGGLELYRVAAERCRTPDLRARFEEFGAQTAHHRVVLVRLIEQVGGDPSYISPCARVAQYKAAKLLETSMIFDGLSQQEVEMNDLENLLLAETKDTADWHLLDQLAQRIDDPQLAQAIRTAVAEVEPEEDEHLRWANEQCAAMGLAFVLTGPAPLPERWQEFISAPQPPIEELHPAPVTDGLLATAKQAFWQDTPAVRAVRG